MKTKRGAITDHLVEIIVAIVILVLLVFVTILLKKSGFSLIDKIKGILFGGAE